MILSMVTRSTKVVRWMKTILKNFQDLVRALGDFVQLGITITGRFLDGIRRVQENRATTVGRSGLRGGPYQNRVYDAPVSGQWCSWLRQ